MNKLVDGKIVQLTESEMLAVIESRKPNRAAQKEQLWNSCNSYQESKISVGGMLRLYPFQETHSKSIAIKYWLENLWADYYTRKAAVDAGEPVNFDFTNNGELPFSYLEAIAETR